EGRQIGDWTWWDESGQVTQSATYADLQEGLVLSEDPAGDIVLPDAPVAESHWHTTPVSQSPSRKIKATPTMTLQVVEEPALLLKAPEAPVARRTSHSQPVRPAPVRREQ